MIYKIANDLIKEMPFTKEHITIETDSSLADYLIVKFGICTSENNFIRIKKFLESYGYFDKVNYWYSEAKNGHGELTASYRKWNKLNGF